MAFRIDAVRQNLLASIKPIERLFLTEKKVNQAMAGAITLTAVNVKDRLVQEMKTVFDRPTPWALRSMYATKAAPNRLFARVWLKDDFGLGGPSAAYYIEPHISGGRRSAKGFEQTLRHGNRNVLGPDRFAMPGAEARLDRYGNMSRGQIIQILSQLNLQRTAGFDRGISNDPKKRKAAIKRAGGRFFHAVIGGTEGIWQREFGGNRVKPILIFTKAPQYKRRLEFQKVADVEARNRLEANMRKSIDNVSRGII